MRGERILMGVIGRPHGVRGLVHVHSYADGDLAAYAPLLDEQGREWSLAWRGDGIAELRDPAGSPLPDRNAAERLVNAKLYVTRDRLPASEEDDFYWSDLVGMQATLPDGKPLGRVLQVHDYGAGPSLEMEGGLLVPFTKACVPSVDMSTRTLKIIPPNETVLPLPPGEGRGEGGQHDDGRGAAMTWHATIFTLFPAMFPGPLAHSLAGKALGQHWSLDVRDIRAATTDRHRTVDDTPFGGGAGMVMRPDVLDAAIGADDDRPLLYLSPRGPKLTQDRVRSLAAGPGLRLLCGRYEGVDQRLLDARGAEEVSIGDYVLSGGELPALVLLDACIRLLPGVMGAATSADEESFSAGLLEYPHYTRPADWQGREVPKILLSGHHAAIAAWRREQSEALTRRRRPDLWQARPVAAPNGHRAGCAVTHELERTTP